MHVDPPILAKWAGLVEKRVDLKQTCYSDGNGVLQVNEWYEDKMYKMNSVLSFVRGACQHLLQPMNLPCRTSGGNILRPLYSSPVRLLEAEIQTQPDASTNPTKSSKEFSFYPPFPGQDSGLRWGGKSFEELPIVHIKATYNNTHIQVTDSVGQSLTRTSCGTEGFRNVKKSTPIAAQTTGISAAAKVQAKGVTFVRVMVKGLGPGRSFCVFSLVLRSTVQKHAVGFTGDTEVDSVNVFEVYMHTSAIKGLTMGGLEIVSITDGTPVPHNGCRPRKARRI